MKKVQRTYYPGDHWVYFKIYAGYKVSEEVLVSVLFPLMQKWMREKWISKWFFIRYRDTDHHIRLRLYLDDTARLGEVVSCIHSKLKGYFHPSLLNDLCMATYNRELERYGAEYIEFSESLFCIDSECTASCLRHLNKKNEDYRWMISFALIDAFLKDIGYDMDKKLDCMKRMNESYRAEFGYDKYNAKQLNDLYRMRKPAMDLALQKPDEDEELKEIRNLIGKRSKKIRALCAGIDFPENNTTSYLHMMMNRLFRSEPRTHELLIYEFMHRYYKSEKAKLNYNG